MRKIFIAAAFCLFQAGAAYASCDSIAEKPHRSLPCIATSAGGAVVLNAAATEVLKHSVHELRPDRSANNSFPSRHTSWAFTASTVIANELHAYSPWFALGAHAVAGAVGFDRVVERRHYGSDVVAGAVLGVASTELAYLIGRKIFGERSPWYSERCHNDFRPEIAVNTGAFFAPGSDLCTAFTTTVQARIPVSEKWGIAVNAGGFTAPVKSGGVTAGPVDGIGLSAGAVMHYVLPMSWLALEPALTAGANRWIGGREYARRAWNATATAEIGLSWRLTKKFACRANVGYSFVCTHGMVSGICAGVSSVAVF